MAVLTVATVGSREISSSLRARLFLLDDVPLSTGTNTHMLQTRAYENHVYYIFTNAHQTLFISEEGAIEAMGSEGTVTYHSVNTSRAPGVLKGWPQRRPNTSAPQLSLAASQNVQPYGKEELTEVAV